MTSWGACRAVVIPDTGTDVVFGREEHCREEKHSLGHCQ